MKLNVNSNNIVYTLIGMIFFILAFDMLNHSALYFLSYCIAIVGIIGCNKKYWQDVFIKYYSFYCIWGIVVTIFSFDKLLSLRELIAVSVPLFIYIAINEQYLKDKDKFIIIINRLMIAFICWMFIILVLSKIQSNIYIIERIKYLTNYSSRINFSTYYLFGVAYALFFFHNLRVKIVILLSAFIAGYLYHDGCFWFTLLILSVVYYIACSKPSFKVISFALVVCVLFLYMTYFVVINVLHYNLHVYERVLVYRYWFPHLLNSPIYGVGLGVRELANYYSLGKYPVPHEWAVINPLIYVHSHIVFVDIALETGFIGIFLYVLFLYKLIKNIFSNYGYYAWAALSIMIVAFGKNLVDDLFEGSKGVIYWLFMIVGIIAAKAYYEQTRCLKND